MGDRFMYVGPGPGVRVEVRCCCEPVRLLGTLPVPVPDWSKIHAGLKVHFWVPEPAAPGGAPARGGRGLMLEIAEWQILKRRSELETELYAGDPTAPVVIERGLALKSDDTPLEVLRRIPGFQEAT